MYSTLNDQLQIIEQLKVYTKDKDILKLDASYNYCMDVMQENSKSFYFASQQLPTKQKYAVGALYAFCRLIDDIVDESDKRSENIHQILDHMKITISKLSQGEISDHVILHAFGDTMRNYKIPTLYIYDLIEGVRMDLFKKEYTTNQELDLYCYRVASTVGLMMVHIFMENPSPTVLARAADLGLAMQLTNILRDVKEDFLKGRIYLPEETRKLYGVSKEDIMSNNLTENFKNLLMYEIERTKGIYKVSELGIKELPKEVRTTIFLASRVYGDILNQIKRINYEILTKRAVVSKKRKVIIALRIKIVEFLGFF